tara:strand:- start:2336 stop:4597 length:2262 start_codon:yes stop_codon:yes gene_type:complete
LIIAENSAVRDNESYRPYITEYESMERSKESLHDINRRIDDLLPTINDSLARLQQSYKALFTEEKKLLCYSKQLGQDAYAGLQNGRRFGNTLFGDLGRDKAHSCIERLVQKRNDFIADDHDGVIERFQAWAARLILTTRIKLVDFKVDLINRRLGRSLIEGELEKTVSCDQTREVLDLIALQRNRVANAQANCTNAHDEYARQLQHAAQTLLPANDRRDTGHTPPRIGSPGDLRSMQRVNQREIRRINNRIAELSQSLIAMAIDDTSLQDNSDLAHNLKVLAGIKSNTNPATAALHNLSCRFKRLPPRHQHGAYVIAGGMAFLLIASFILSNAIDNTDSDRTSHANIDSDPDAPAQRVLAIVVPGTYGNDGSWNRIIPGKETFSSRLLKELPEGSDVIPFIWSSGNDHDKRVEAAKNLVVRIDENASDYDRTVLIGHSHGGNICLMAAGECSSPIDTIVCLSTPHTYLKTQTHYLPVYCSPETRANVDKIVSVVVEGDIVVGFWADLFTGVSENKAIALVESWRKETNFPPLENDGFLDRILFGDNLLADSYSLFADENISITSTLDASHSHTHSHRIGTTLGQSIAEGTLSSFTNMHYLVLSKGNCSEGEPRTPEQDPVDKYAIAWVAENITLNFDPNVNELERNSTVGLGKSDPFIVIIGKTGLEWRSKTLENIDVNKPQHFVSSVENRLWVEPGINEIHVWDSDFITQHRLDSMAFTAPEKYSSRKTIQLNVKGRNGLAWGTVTLKPLFR